MNDLERHGIKEIHSTFPNRSAVVGHSDAPSHPVPPLEIWIRIWNHLELKYMTTLELVCKRWKYNVWKYRETLWATKSDPLSPMVTPKLIEQQCFQLKAIRIHHKLPNLTPLFSLIRRQTRLETLELRYQHEITYAHCESVLRSRCPTTLEHLSIEQTTKIDADGLSAILQSCVHLKSISFSFTFVPLGALLELCPQPIPPVASGSDAPSQTPRSSGVIVRSRESLDTEYRIHCSRLERINLFFCDHLPPLFIHEFVRRTSFCSPRTLSYPPCTLTCLNLGRTKIGPREQQCIARSCPRLCHLLLNSCCGVTDEGMCVIFQGCLELQTLDISKTRLSDRIWDHLCHVQQPLLPLKHLYMNKTLFSSGAIAHMISHQKGLIILHCAGTQTTDSQLRLLWEHHRDTLREVNLSTTAVSASAIQALLANCPQLTCVKASNQRFDSVFPDVNVTRRWNLTSLCLKACPNVTNSAFSGQREFLKASHLKSVNLSGTAVSDETLRVLGQDCPHLSHLGLNETQVTNEGIVWFVGTGKRDKLEKIELQFTKITDTAALLLAETQRRSLRHLQLGFTRVAREETLLQCISILWFPCKLGVSGCSFVGRSGSGTLDSSRCTVQTLDTEPGGHGQSTNSRMSGKDLRPAKPQPSPLENIQHLYKKKFGVDVCWV